MCFTGNVVIKLTASQESTNEKRSCITNVENGSSTTVSIHRRVHTPVGVSDDVYLYEDWLTGSIRAISIYVSRGSGSILFYH